jgi:hypothetical protein
VTIGRVRGALHEALLAVRAHAIAAVAEVRDVARTRLDALGMTERAEAAGDFALKLHVQFWLCGSKVCRPIEARRSIAITVAAPAPPPAPPDAGVDAGVDAGRRRRR